jgi:hypothetical protein
MTPPVKTFRSRRGWNVPPGILTHTPPVRTFRSWRSAPAGAQSKKGRFSRTGPPHATVRKWSYRFLLTVAAALLAPSFTASLASPRAFCASPLSS